MIPARIIGEAAIKPPPTLPAFPHPIRLLYSGQAWAQLLRAGGARIMREHLEWNYDAVAPHVACDDRLLDIGAWDCSLARELRDRIGADVYGVDVVDKNRSDIPFSTFDGKILPFSDKRFDVVLLMYVLHHSADDTRLLAEARRVLGANGLVLIAEDMVESRWQRALTLAFHIWLFSVSLMGWKGHFRKIEAWRAKLVQAGLELREVIALGCQGGRKWFPRNMLLIAGRAGESAQTGQ